MKAERSATQLALLRHAETRWNRDKRIQGQQDAPLTSHGRRQAERWGRALRRCQWDHMVTSDLGRANLTAAIINRSLDISCSVEPRLREQNWGSWAGLKFSDLDASEFGAQENMGWHFRPAGGESRLEVLERSQQALVDIGQRWRGNRILIITHGGVMKCLIYGLFNREFLPQESRLLESYRLQWIGYDGAALHVQQLNQRIQ